jgi:Uma2 family endonuclease
MTAALPYMPPGHVWTTDDLDALPEDGVRRELLDGVLLVSPSPTRIHQKIAALLTAALDETCPAHLDVTQNVNVRFSERRSFAPDVLVITDAAARRAERSYMPHEVVLAVEIVSPTSVSMDRITKPALYAQAGIPFYWCIETDHGITVRVYKLDPGNKIYAPAGTFTDRIEISEPWPIEIPIGSLTPRYL